MHDYQCNQPNGKSKPKANGVAKMYQEIRHTIFQVEPLKNIVGVGDITAYQIIVIPGTTIGTLGNVTVPAQAEIHNDSAFSRNSAMESGRFLLASWCRRALATLKF